MSVEHAESESVREVYARAGFGGHVQLGVRPGLVVVDFTRGFTEPDFPSGADMSVEVATTARLISAFRRSGFPVILTAIVFSQAEVDSAAYPWLDKATGMRALVDGSPTIDIDPRLGARGDEIVIEKKSASAFFGTALATILTRAGCDTVVIAGATTSGCVRATAVDSVQSGFPTLVIRDAVADRARGPHNAALFDLQEKYADVVNSADVLRHVTQLSGSERP